MFLRLSDQFVESPRKCFKFKMRRSKFLLSQLCFLLALVAFSCEGFLQQAASNIQPTFRRSMDLLTVKENTQIGEVIYKLEAFVERAPNAKISYGIEGTSLFSVDKLEGTVRVAQAIDREQTGDSISFRVTAQAVYQNLVPNGSSGSSRPQIQLGSLAEVPITVFILDENDNPPRIERVIAGSLELDSATINRQSVVFGNQIVNKSPVLRLNVNESLPVGSVIVDLIEAIDLDKVSAEPLSSWCLNCDSEFELRATTEQPLNDRLNLSIVLVNQLVHIPRNNLRQLQVSVSDGKFNTSFLFEVNIEDIQNKPPQFIGSSTCIIEENLPIDKTIMTVRAVDGDALGLADESLLQANKLPASALQRGRPILYELVGFNGQEPSEAGQVLKLHPLTGQLQVANRIDREAYLAANGILGLRVRARELTVEPESVVRQDELRESMLAKLAAYADDSPEAASELDITVIVADVNDNEPHWLNASEINSLNMNHSPFWFASLPLGDRDTGRIYSLQVRENSPAGSPITSNNDMFVYDLDNGQNANFNITLLDPFNLFEVEPKQVSGFAQISLKLASAGSGQRRSRLLDYENQNERSFIIQLIATETNTNERYSSKAQVQVSVLDVNDNAPEFKESAYQANIREDAPPGKTVLLVQASDRDEVSAKQLSYSLHGRSAHLFEVNKQSGLITVAKCQPEVAQPTGRASSSNRQQPATTVGRQCIDYEQQRAHHLMVGVTDGELSSKVPLTIFIDDAPDNAPSFTLPVVDVVIEEGSDRFEPPVKIEATDVDQSSVLNYTIVEGNFEGLFSINNATGELQLTRPIRISHDEIGPGDDYRQHQLNKMSLIVQVSDGFSVANGTIRIDVLDANDNAPNFIRPEYRAELEESAEPGRLVVSVRAVDLDRGNNAKVSYTIQRGSYGQFEIEPSTGAIRVARGASPFEASQRANYTLEVLAHDHGLNTKSSSALVYVTIRSSNRRPAKFEPQVQRASVHESTPNNTIIHRMQLLHEQAGQPEENGHEYGPKPAELVFEPGPIEALDKNGQPVALDERLESMFGVSTNTGEVMVSSNLNHDYAAIINLTVYATFSRPLDKGSSQEEYAPKSVGYLIITVLDDNTNAPSFAPPWTPEQPELSFQMLEELPVGSILTQLMASDLDSKISHYKIEPASDYFELVSPQSGVIRNKRVIDYDALMRQTFLTPGLHHLNHHHKPGASSEPPPNNNILQFNVYAFDSGLPQLSAKATVSVEILPVNDNDCKFEHALYEVRLKENSVADTLVLQVRANDLDVGEQHNSLRYQLAGEHSEFFNIDPKSGLVQVSQRGEKGLDRERLSQATISLTVIARDEQVPPEATRSQQPVSLFRLKAKEQPAAQLSASEGSRACSATIKINVEDVNDNPPLFSQKLYEVSAYDTDIVQVPLIKLLVRDADQSPSNKSLNSFRIVAGNLNDTFAITNAGLLYATKPLNVTSSKTIQLSVQVKQQLSSPGSNSQLLTPFIDECLVNVNLVRINRYGPEWRQDVINKQLSVMENSKPGTLITHLKCIDRDFETRSSLLSAPSQQNNLTIENNFVRYFIKQNGSNLLETEQFKLDPNTGRLTTRVELDREAKEFYQLVVSCQDNGKPQSLESVAPIYISVLDVDDNKPEFVAPKGLNVLESYQQVDRLQRRRQLSVSFPVLEHQSKGLPIGELKAIDRDLEGPHPISYCLIEGDEFGDFLLDQITGILYTNQTLDREKQASYKLLVKAINDGSTCGSHAPLNASENSTSLNSQNLKTVDRSHLSVRIEVLDINDNAPVFKKTIYRTGVHHRAIMNSLVKQVAAFDPDAGQNGTLSYKITEILSYRTIPNPENVLSRVKYEVSAEQHTLSKPQKLVQFPFKIDQHGNIYTQQLLSQYHLTTMFLVSIEATELAEPWRTARTKLEVYIYETNNQLKIRINLHPRMVEAYKPEIETLLSNATKYTAIINRARNYYEPSSSNNNQQKSTNSIVFDQADVNNPPPLATGNNVQQQSIEDLQQPSFSNIHLIFVDNFRIVNPSLVMEKFDLTSAQLFMPQSLQQTTSGANQLQSQSQKQLQINDVSSLIDKIALSSVQASEYQSGGSGGGGPSSLVGIDWLESPAALYSCLTILLLLVGFIIFLFGCCCCTSRIKDHIIKVAMDKLVKQQNLQAKINEQVLAATNQAAHLDPNHRLSAEYMQGGYMSSFDATKGCISNNIENMNILQRAMESGEFVDPNYLTINGHVNMGAHFYDASELEQQEQKQQTDLSDLGANSKPQQYNESSIIMGEELDEDDYENNQEDLNCNGNKAINYMSNGIATSNTTTTDGRQRQQIPNNHIS